MVVSVVVVVSKVPPLPGLDVVVVVPVPSTLEAVMPEELELPVVEAVVPEERVLPELEAVVPEELEPPELAVVVPEEWVLPELEAVVPEEPAPPELEVSVPPELAVAVSWGGGAWVTVVLTSLEKVLSFPKMS